jgi:nucleotide-binding universal stress UspA family protein
MELTGSGLEIHPVTREGDAAQEILHLSDEVRADVVVMRTHGRAGLERAVFGSIAEEVLKKTTIPLILVRPGGRRVTRIHKLLVPVDGSPGGLLALQMADGLAKATGSSIGIVQVVVPIPMLVYVAPYDPSGAGFYDSAWDDDALTAARTYVAAVCARLRGRGPVVEAEARMAPSVAEGIVDTADEGDADLIVMSTHALTGPARTILGSVADAVVRTSPCPVLLVKRIESHASPANNEWGEPPC